MRETSEHVALQRVLALPGLIAAGLYRWQGEALEYVGERPGLGWHVHGWCCRWLKVIIGGRVQRVRLHKRRWRHGRRGPTCHSRPPDERAFIGVSSLLIVIKLYGWLNYDSGLHSRAPAKDAVGIAIAPRTMLRWLRRALPGAMAIQQAIREAVIERCEPRPVEQMFPTGLAPPDGLTRRRWKDATSTLALWRGFALLFRAAIEFDVNPSLLLAEARGRISTKDDFPA